MASKRNHVGTIGDQVRLGHTLTPMQNYDQTNQPFGYAVKECTERLEHPLGEFDSGLF
jgi:hypothetical protein